MSDSDRLWQAFNQNDQAAVKSIIKTNSMNLDTPLGPRGWTALHIAAEKNWSEVITLLIQKGANKESSTPGSQRTPLLVAAELGHVDAIKTLVTSGANLQATNRDGHVATRIAASNKHKAAVRLLRDLYLKYVQTQIIEGKLNEVIPCLSDGAMDEPITARGWNALHVAVEFNQRDIAVWLLQKGADKECKTLGSQRTPLLIAAELGHVDMVKLLLSKNVVRDATNKDGCQALHLAVKANELAVVRELVGSIVTDSSSGIVNTPLPNSWTPLHIAAEFGTPEMVQLLISLGANKESKTSGSERTPLLIAAELGREAIVAQLLENQVNVNAVNKGGDTALMLALRNRHFEVAQALIQAGANQGLPNKQGLTARQLAQQLHSVGFGSSVSPSFYLPSTPATTSSRLMSSSTLSSPVSTHAKS